MDEGPDNDPVPPPTLGGHVFAAMRRINRRRPASFYLLLAMVAAALMGGPLVWSMHDPRKFALCLSLSFIFFFVILLRAIVDFFELGRKFFSEREQLFKNTLGEPDFVERLGQRVNGHEDR
jgi:heme A synthase